MWGVRTWVPVWSLRLEVVLGEYLNEMREKEALTTPYDVLDPSA